MLREKSIRLMYYSCQKTTNFNDQFVKIVNFFYVIYKDAYRILCFNEILVTIFKISLKFIFRSKI